MSMMLHRHFSQSSKQVTEMPKEVEEKANAANTVKAEGATEQPKRRGGRPRKEG